MACAATPLSFLVFPLAFALALALRLALRRLITTVSHCTAAALFGSNFGLRPVI